MCDDSPSRKGVEMVGIPRRRSFEDIERQMVKKPSKYKKCFNPDELMVKVRTSSFANIQYYIMFVCNKQYFKRLKTQ